MIFAAFKEFKREAIKTWQEAAQWLQTDLSASLRELRTGLYRLRFDENFECFVVSVTIPAGEELPIRNKLPSRQIPAWWIALRQNDGALSVVDGDTEWNADQVFLKNVGGTDAVLTVAFFK